MDLKRRIAFALAAPLFLSFVGCPEAAGLRNGTPEAPFTIAVGQFSMETCTFCPDTTGIIEWLAAGEPDTGEQVLSRGGYIEGFSARTSEYGGVRLVGLRSPKYPMTSGIVKQDAFDKFAGDLINSLRDANPVDGVFLALHGAMAVDGIAKPEAELARRVRVTVGPDVPIVVTLDSHANFDDELSSEVDAILIVKQYPHADSRSTGEAAGRLMIKILRGEFRPVMVTRKPGVLTPSVAQWTGETPALNIMERARAWEARNPDTFVSVAMGHASADVPDIGATVVAVSNADEMIATRIAEDMSMYIWNVREAFFDKHIPWFDAGVREAVDAVETFGSPVVIADQADLNGDATWVTRELLDQGASRFVIATIADSMAIRELQESATVGEIVQLKVGGTSDSRAGTPIEINGVLEFFGNRGRGHVARIKFGEENHIILTTGREQVTSPTILEDVNLSIEDVDLIIIKSRANFRPGFYDNKFAKHVVVVDAPGWAPYDLSKLPYQHVPNGTYPLTFADLNGTEARN